MKQFLVIAFMLISSSFARAQDQTIVGNAYITVIDNIEVDQVDLNGVIIAGSRFLVPKGTKFNVNKISNGQLIITFWNYPGGTNRRSLPAASFSATPATATTFVGSWANNINFTIGLEEFNNGCKRYFKKSWDFTWGVMTLPIKARFGNGSDRYFDVEENLNLGFSFGLRRQIQSRKEQAWNLLLGISLTRAKVDSVSLKPEYKAPESSVATALMTSVGFLYQYETFQVGIFTGVDHIMGDLGRGWKYQGRPWLGFAVGVSLFSRNKTERGEDGEN